MTSTINSAIELAKKLGGRFFLLTRIQKNPYLRAGRARRVQNHAR